MRAAPVLSPVFVAPRAKTRDKPATHSRRRRAGMVGFGMRPDRGFRVLFEAPAPTSTPAERLRATCELREVAIAQLEARLRREQPDITDAQVREAVREWLAAGDPGWGTPRAATE